MISLVSIVSMDHVRAPRIITIPIVNKVPVEYSYYTAQWNDSSDPVQIRNNYHVDLVLDTNTKTYTAKMVIDIYNDSADIWNSVYFRDYPSAFKDQQNGHLSEITDIKNVETNQVLLFTRDTDPTVFSIQLDQPLAPGKTVSVSFQYKAYVPTLNARYGYQMIDDSGNDYYLGNSIPILCPYDDGKFQYYPYFAIGECFYSRMANYDVTVTTPDDYVVIATGEEISQNLESNQLIHHYVASAVRDFTLVIGNEYKVISDKVDGITINSYYHSGREDIGKAALDVAANNMRDWDSRIGTYPYHQFSVVETQMEMYGMEYPQMVMVTMTESGVPSIVHEMMHQWFYSLIGSNSYTSPWLDESMATYLSNPGLDTYKGVITQPYSAFASDEDYKLAIYFCGASMYNRLEEEFGKDTMNQFLLDLLSRYAYKEISTQEMVDLLVQYFGKDNEILNEYIEPQYLQNGIESAAIAQ